MPYADGAIVGTNLKKDDIGENPVGLERVKRCMDTMRRVREKA